MCGLFLRKTSSYMHAFSIDQNGDHAFDMTLSSVKWRGLRIARQKRLPIASVPHAVFTSTTVLVSTLATTLVNKSCISANSADRSMLLGLPRLPFPKSCVLVRPCCPQGIWYPNNSSKGLARLLRGTLWTSSCLVLAGVPSFPDANYDPR